MYQVEDRTPTEKDILIWDDYLKYGNDHVCTFRKRLPIHDANANCLWRRLWYRGLDRYSVSEYGEIRDDATNQLVPSTTMCLGDNPIQYLWIDLLATAGFWRWNVHLLINTVVAQHFLAVPQYGQDMVINKDGNVLNTHYSNLEWRASVHSPLFRYGEDYSSVAVVLTNQNGEEISFPSQKAAAEYLHVSPAAISGALKNHRGVSQHNVCIGSDYKKYRRNISEDNSIVKLPAKKRGKRPTRLYITTPDGRELIACNQTKAAQLIGVSQMAVSKALRENRPVNGHMVSTVCSFLIDMQLFEKVESAIQDRDELSTDTEIFPLFGTNSYS